VLVGNSGHATHERTDVTAPVTYVSPSQAPSSVTEEIDLEAHSGLRVLYKCTLAIFEMASDPKKASPQAAVEAVKDYLWDHFQFNAEQRLKAFNYFVVLSVFANGGVFAAYEKRLDAIAFVLIGALLIALSVVFLVIDIRSKELINLSLPGLKSYELLLPEQSRIFTIDGRRPKLRPRYTLAFRALIGLQLIFGAGVIIFGFLR
jgi:hypothetical protein